MTVVAEHALRNVARDVHDGLIASSAFRKIRDKGVPVVVPPSRHLGFFADILPGRLEGSDGSRRIAWGRPSKREDIPLRASLAELLSVPDSVFPQNWA